MTRQVVLVRGINVGKAKRLAMADLREILTGLGGTGVRTLLESGNAVLDADDDALGAKVEKALAHRLGLDVRVLTRTATELDAVVAANPFPEKVATPKLLHVAFLAADPDPALAEEVGMEHGGDVMAFGDRVIYLSYTTNSHASPLIKPLQRLGGVATTRNWSTVTKLAEMASE